MIAKIILLSVKNRALVLIVSALLLGWGIISILRTPLDAIPDLSDVQVIIKTTFAGQSPDVVEDQVTYPISTAMISVPKTTAVRGFSFFGDSYVYVVFEEGTDIYWARARVLEYLSQVRNLLPQSVLPQLGPDATGVGWIYQYALVDRTRKHDLADLRELQDWYLRFELQTIPGVSEVAAVGGMVKQYQIVLSPNKMRAYSITLAQVEKAIKRGNQETGGSVIEQAEAEYMIRASGYIKNLNDIRKIPVALHKGVPILIEHIADVRVGPQMRRGIAELDGMGEVVGGIVVMRWGENALHTIERVKEKLKSIKKGLPPGVEIVETYDRSKLIMASVNNLIHKLLEEGLVVALVCFIFLFHLRSALVAFMILPMGIACAFIVMSYQGINANIMSLSGIAIAIGAMVDASIVMIENVHKHMEKQQVNNTNRWQIIVRATTEVGPALFFSLLIITLSFIPVFTLEAQEGKLFGPLAFTKSYSMGAAALLSITLMPVLMGYFIRGRIPSERRNPINRILIALYMPVIKFVLRAPWLIVLSSLALIATIIIPFQGLGNEFMPELDEGDILYMPTTFPGISVGKAGELLQQTDRLIRSVPEVKRVFGKIGRAETATDPAPLTMIETTIQLKPKDQWRPGVTTEHIIKELDTLINFPGVTNAWVMPIKTRIDMISTGVKTPIGIKISGDDLYVIQDIGIDIEKTVKEIKGTSVFSERTMGGRYINVEIDRAKAAIYGLNIADIHDVISRAVGGSNVTFTVEGLKRFPVNIRYPLKDRDSLSKLNMLPVMTKLKAHIALSDVAKLSYATGPAMIKTENARKTGWVFVDVDKSKDLASYITEIQKKLDDNIKLPPGYTISFVGQYEYLLRFQKKMILIVPFTLLIIMLLLYLNFRNFTESFMVMLSVPMALVGAFWFLYLLGDYHLSVAVWVGIIALAGVAAEFGVVMLVYLDNALKEFKPKTVKELGATIIHGAVLRVRPKAMTASVIIAGLLPIMYGEGAGSEVMSRIAAPMLGGMITAPLVSMVLIPALYFIWRKRLLPREVK